MADGTYFAIQNVLQNEVLRNPKTIILPNFSHILTAITNTAYMGEMRVRWNEIKKLRQEPKLALAT